MKLNPSNITYLFLNTVELFQDIVRKYANECITHSEYIYDIFFNARGAQIIIFDVNNELYSRTITVSIDYLIDNIENKITPSVAKELNKLD